MADVEMSCNMDASGVQSMPWDDLRRLMRKLQDEADQKLLSYSKLTQDVASPTLDEESGAACSFQKDSAEALEREIEGLLKRMASLNATMADARNAGKGGAAADKQVERHREILQDYEREYRKTKANMKCTRDRAELLRSVRRQITEHHDAAGALLRERSGINHSNLEALRVLQQAEEAKGRLNTQRTVFSGVGSNLERLKSRFPAINDVIVKVQRKKSRDAIILAVVVAVCCFLVFLYLR
eukprot:GGOE01000429.1.p2 GENE.GGOE01000429.1~~GGOE01000429.1.p2  ORF type:complete len:256 (-),score=95.90 GGOE01000429.1:226-948(-)